MTPPETLELTDARPDSPEGCSAGRSPEDSDAAVQHLFELEGVTLDPMHHVGTIDVTDPGLHDRADLIRCAREMIKQDGEVSVIKVIATDRKGEVMAEADLKPDRVRPVCESSVLQSAVNEMTAGSTDIPTEYVRAIERADEATPRDVDMLRGAAYRPAA